MIDNIRISLGQEILRPTTLLTADSGYSSEDKRKIQPNIPPLNFRSTEKQKPASVPADTK